MYSFEVSIIPQWPKIKLIINGPNGRVQTTESVYDTAFTNFEVHVKNALQSTINEVLQKRKRGL